ncbi:hypothetical protein BsWGS_17312 [Bradybaena similaris]
MPCKCCVPGCRSNYRGQEYISMFTFPTNPGLKEKWLELIGRKDYIVKKNSLVCAKHFEPHLVITANRVKRADGTLLSTPRTRVKLQNDALPTIFSQASSSSSAELPRKRIVTKDEKSTEGTGDADNCLIKDSVSFRSLCKEIDSHIHQLMSNSNLAVTAKDKDTSRCPQVTALLTMGKGDTTQENPNFTNKSVVENDSCQKIETIDSGMYSCPHCSAVLSHRSMLYKHISEVHSNSSSEEGGASAVVCAEYSDKPVNTGHHESDGNNKLKCVSSINSQDDITELIETRIQKLIHENSSLLKLRSKSVYTNKKTFKCEFCGAAFEDSSKLKAHTSKHTGVKPFQCDMCGAGFTVAENLRLHIRKHTGEKPFVCDECGAAFISSKNLRVHRTSHTGEKPYNCDLCGSGFNRAYSLQAHMVKHTGVKPFKCEVCGVGFTVKSRVQIHMRIHTGEKPYACDDCGARFVTRRQLKVHRVSHTGEKPYKCDVCGAGFNQAFNLQVHKRKNTEENPYSCDKGQKRYRCVTGPKPYVCEVCGQQFYSTSGLRQHKKKHTGKSTPHKCDVCGVAFTAKISLINHQRKHTGETPYSCDICDLRFSVIESLQNHRRKHTGEKPYPCDICDAKFAFRSSLQDHRRLHTGEKPYKCDLCGADFSNPKKLKRHKKIHSGSNLQSSGGSSFDLSERGVLMLV